MWQASNNAHFFKTMVTSDSLVLPENDCLAPICDVLNDSTALDVEETLPLLEFIKKEFRDLYRLYRRICSALERVTNLNSHSVKEMVNLASEW